MALTTLKDDLMQEFREERIMINEQMEILDPLGTSLRRPAAQRLISSTTLVLTEVVCYALFIGGIALGFTIHSIYPFSLMNTVYHDTEITARLGGPNVNNFLLAGYGCIALATLLVLILGRMARVIRLKNDILHQAGKDMKIILGQHLERKAAIDTIEQRHLLDLSGIAVPMKPKATVNDIVNPGYDEDEEDI